MGKLDGKVAIVTGGARGLGRARLHRHRAHRAAGRRARAGENDQARHIPLRRVGEPEDCAKVVEFLVIDLSDYVTGALIPVDGGWNRAA